MISYLPLIKVSNSNTEADKLQTLSDLDKILENVTDISTKNIIMGGDFNFHFNSNLESEGGKPILKKRSFAKMIQIIEKFDLCDIWRIRNPFSKRFTFRQNHYTGHIQRKLYYFFI